MKPKKTENLKELAKRENKRMSEQKIKIQTVIQINSELLEKTTPVISKDWQTARSNSNIEKYKTISFEVENYIDEDNNDIDEYINLIVLYELKYPNNEKIYNSRIYRQLIKWIDDGIKTFYLKGNFEDEENYNFRVINVYDSKPELE